ncbi:hypothetical protein, partial [Planktotalea sp.]|uniref:hypothetical protein n=1 Tax=Planktotalea sp. TaxID=2029877 RepID=UPI003F6B9F16
TAHVRELSRWIHTVNPTVPDLCNKAGANTTIGDANALTPSALVGVAASSAVRVLTFDTNNDQIGDVAGVYDPLSNEVTIAGTGYALASDGNSAAGKLIGGGNNLAAIIQTPSAMVPTGGSATLRGTGDVIYVNQPTSQVFTRTMNATVTANFATDRVNITMNNPNGQIDGVAYASGGSIEVDELALNGAKYQDDNRTTGSVTGFVGATDLNSGSQTVNALGILGGATANETAAVAQITDGSRGTAILRVTAQE